MEVRLRVYIDERDANIVLRSIQINDHDPIHLTPSGKQAFSSALLLLFVCYRQWCESGNQPAEFSLQRNQHPKEVPALVSLLRASRKPKHWSKRIFQIERPKNNDASETNATNGDGEWLRIPRGAHELGIKQGVFSKDDIKILLDNSDEPLSGKDNLDDLSKLLVLLRDPISRGILSAPGPHSSASIGIRQDLTYSVQFGLPLVNPIQFDGDEYHHYEAKLEFSRLSLRTMDSFRVYASQAESISLDKDGVVYVEKFTVTKNDQETLDKLLTEVVSAPLERKQGCLEKIIRASALVNDEPAILRDVEKDKYGFFVTFGMPEKSVKRLGHKFKLTFSGFWPRQRCYFPIVVSEPTKRATLDFSYEKAPLENVKAFIGARIWPNRIQASPVPLDGAVRIQSPDSIYLFPGEGALIHWTQKPQIQPPS